MPALQFEPWNGKCHHIDVQAIIDDTVYNRKSVVVYMKMFKDQFFVVLQKYTRTSQIVYNRKCKGLIAILPCLFWPKLSVVFSAAIFLQFTMHEVKL